jgi:hypothetical protein
LTVTRYTRVLGRIAKPLWRFALGEHRGHQVQQWTGEVVLSDLEIPVIDVDMIDSAARSRPVRQSDRQGASIAPLVRDTRCGRQLGLPGLALPGAAWRLSENPGR